jgi:DNA-binding NtrC family response regulator
MTDQTIAKAHILILDEDQNVQTAVRSVLTTHGYHVTCFQKTSEALQALREDVDHIFDLVFSDIRVPEMDELTFVNQVKQLRPEIPVILMTEFGTLDNAIEAIRSGAFDFLKKPFKTHEVLLSVDRALGHYKILKENRLLSDEILHKWKLDQIIGKSQKMQDVFDLIKRVAHTSATVLITGESGTGKEMIARAIHENGSQKTKPFVAINCAAIPEGLLESELFGHSKGSFTGAHQARKGLFQEADGGTLFLDEIGDMSMGLQAKLLRVLQDKKVKPVGENGYKKVDVRILAATNRSLKASIKQGEFREDLFYRLNVISIEIPPLRDRKEDIILLAQHFLQKYSAIHHATAKRINKMALANLMKYPWPGNIRELENLIERSVVICSGVELQEKDLAFDRVEVDEGFRKPENSEYLTLDEVEMRYIAFILEKTGGKKEEAARILKIDRTTLHRRVSENPTAKPAESPNDSGFFEAINKVTPQS